MIGLPTTITRWVSEPGDSRGKYPQREPRQRRCYAKNNIANTITTKSVDKTANLSCPLKYQMFTRSVSLP